MSSGVDSSVSAAFFAKSFPNVRGIYMANWSQTAKCTEADWKDVQKICTKLSIPCERVNFEKEYWNDVFTPMINMYEKGLTPNPDVGCNKYVKFGKMIDHLTTKFQQSDKKWWLVTGHYARVMKHNDSGESHLLRSYIKNKDQSFYLANIPGAVLDKVIMPVGHFSKPVIRQLAKELGLHTAEKPDSQGLCFVSQEDSNFRDFLNEYIQPKPGNIVTEDGQVWGTHKGLWHATIGQRLGISMPQGNPLYNGVWFVSEKRPKTNELVIVKGGNNPQLFKKGLHVVEWEWVDSGSGADEMAANAVSRATELTIQFRSLQDPVKLEKVCIEEDCLVFHLQEKARAMAPGQNLVLYDGNRVLGAGIITSTFD